MKKVLFITYVFPPIGGNGIQRSLRFLKYLPQYGIEPVVFCPRHMQWQAHDEETRYPFLDSLSIYRHGISRLKRYFALRFVKGIPTHPYYYFLALRYIWFIDFQSAWFFESRHHALKAAIQEKVDCIFTTSPPHSIHFFGLFLKSKLKLPWIMDLRDAIYDQPIKSFPKVLNPLQLSLLKFYEKRMYNSADTVSAVSNPILESLQSRHPDAFLKSNKSVLITNGYDPDDYLHIGPCKRKRKQLLITYTGSFQGKQTPLHFLEALKHLVEQNVIDPESILLRFIGHFDSSTCRLFDNYSKLLPIEVIEFQPYHKIISYQITSDILLLIVSLETHEGGNQIFTGKVFEYMGAQKPIFALAPGGPLKSAIEKGGFGIVVPPKNINKISKAFHGYYSQWKNTGTINYYPDTRLKNQYNRKRLTQELANRIHKICSRKNN